MIVKTNSKLLNICTSLLAFNRYCLKKILGQPLINLLVVILLLPFGVHAQLTAEQEKKVDSLKQVVQYAPHDTLKVNAILAWGKTIRRADGETYQKLLDKADSICDLNLTVNQSSSLQTFFIKKKSKIINLRGDFHRDHGDYDTALGFYTQALNLIKQTNDQIELAATYNSIGIVYGMQADYKTCEEWMMKSLAIYEQLDDKDGMASTYNNLGNIHYYQGDYKPAIDFWSQSLKMKEETGDKRGMANTLNNIGNIHKAQNDNEKAIDYYNQSLALYEELDAPDGMITTSSNLAGIYLDLGQIEKAQSLYWMCYETSLSLDDKKGISDAYNGLGMVYKTRGNLDSAEIYFNHSLSLREGMGDAKGIAETLNHLAGIYFEKGRIKDAIQLSERSMNLGREMNSLTHIKTAAELLWKINKKINNPARALEMHELYIQIRDSLQSEENKMEIIRHEFEYQYEKQAAADSILASESNKIKDAQIHAKNLESKQRKLENYVLLGILAITLVLGGIIFHRFRVTKVQKGIIETQKLQVDQAYGILEVKNREITDSIKYAQRIQKAILPTNKRVNECLKDSFILYQPKDIVAGDFYWLEERDGKILFAASDCTGHGVPGAMVSVICVNGLNRAVRENGLTEPGKILDKTRELVIAEFEKSDDEVKDGMDISLCSLSWQDMQMQWAGANNPLWIFRKDKQEIQEIKADKQPIGKVENPASFKTHQVAVNKGDIIYLITDGFKDQFGGKKGKKFKASHLKNLLLSVCDESMETQRKIISEAFENWKGNLEQIDDVCILGVRI
ncbi:MAG: tetratricopeptide repeat protein [Crocinitomicaceae bacterium]|nr:tetratricopeptide repeat protein [Crocinitomicaceae bacterium]MBK8926759.1 tetratricopeptide repeat protein [Crocinitomicaceae bacterium]